jgi:phosphohistidine phosphatase
MTDRGKARYCLKMTDRQLLLLRHAKAVLGSSGMDDIERPLAERGQKTSKVIGQWLAEHDLAPALVLCSPARRTRETWEIAARELPKAEVRFLDALYDFGDGSALLQAIRKHGGTAQRLLLVTHNPATQALALALPGSGAKVLLRQIAEKYPTAGLAVMTFSGNDWAGTAEGEGRLDAFIRPRDLMED